MIDISRLKSIGLAGISIGVTGNQLQFNIDIFTLMGFFAMQQDTDFQLTASIPYRDIMWHGVHQQLGSSFGMSKRTAAYNSKRFGERVLTPFESSWFNANCLQPEDNSIASSICSVHGVDRCTIQRAISLPLGPLSLNYRFALTLTPNLDAAKKGQAGGSAVAKVELELLGKKLLLDKRYQVVSARICILMALIALNATALGVALYCLAVLLLFLELPLDVLVAATHSPSIGIAMIFIAVGMAGIVGRVLRMAWGIVVDFAGKGLNG